MSVRKDEKLTKKAKRDCESWRTYFSDNINKYHYMHEFINGCQWTDDEKEEMLKNYSKNSLTSNKLGAMSNVLLGEQQQNTPQLQVVPLVGTDEEVAQLREDVVKNITLSSDASTVYQVAASQAFVGGYSGYYWDTEYTHDHSFDLDIIARYFKDSTVTYFDKSAEKINKTDGMFAGFIVTMSREKFRELYGEDVEEDIARSYGVDANEDAGLDISGCDSDDSDTKSDLQWVNKDDIVIQHHYVREIEKETLYRLSNGDIVNKKELDSIVKSSRDIIKQQQEMLLQQQLQDELQISSRDEYGLGEDIGGDVIGGEDIGNDIEDGSESIEDIEDIEVDEDGDGKLEDSSDVITLYVDEQPVRIESTKEIEVSKIMHYKIASDYILEESEFPSQQLPVVFVDQNSYYDKKGKQITRSFFDDAVDTQKYINYLRTQSGYILKISRYDQYIGSKKNVANADTQRKWADPNTVQGMLTFDESPDGVVPQKLQPPELSQSLHTQYQLALEDLYTSTGLYPTHLGDKGNEVSGVAINARTRQGSYSTYVARNSINRAIAVGGEIVNEMIPKVFDTEREIALSDQTNGVRNVKVNEQDDYGNIQRNLTKGTYQVRLIPGASYEGQKQEALTSLKEILQANPQAFNLIADLYAENLPLMNTIELKNRLKTMVPPEIIEAGKTGKNPEQQGPQQPSPEQQQLMMQQQQAQQQAQLKQEELQIKQQELELKRQQLEIDSQLKKLELETERLEAGAKLQEQELRYVAETHRTNTDEQIAHTDNLTKILTHKL